MNGHFWDCLTGRPADRLGGPPVLGRWRVRVPGPAVPILNKVPVQPGDYLIPNARGEFALRGGGLEVDGAFPAAQRPADLDPCYPRRCARKARLAPFLAASLVVHNRDAPDHTRRKPGISRRSHRFAADFAPTCAEKSPTAAPIAKPSSVEASVTQAW